MNLSHSIIMKKKLYNISDTITNTFDLKFQNTNTFKMYSNTKLFNPKSDTDTIYNSKFLYNLFIVLE